MGDTIMEMKDLALGYDGARLLSGINFEIENGDMWCFLGPNGCGKSTLLKGMIGALRPLAGTITLDERFIRAADIGFVPQRCLMNETLPTTVHEFVTLGTAGLRMGRAAEEESYKRALLAVGLSDMAAKDYRALSGGQKQRALLARTLVRRPKLIILDEPTNGLDMPAEEALLGALEKLNREEGITVVVVTHNLDIAGRFGKKFALFRRGTVLAGPKSITFTPENIKATYGVSVEHRNGYGA